MVNPNPRFRLGRLLLTPGASDALVRSGESPLPFLRLHASGDWGEVGDEDKRLNDRALSDGSRVLSAYVTRLGERIWVVTEADPREATTILLPSEY
jgi:hypothetical protein